MRPAALLVAVGLLAACSPPSAPPPGAPPDAAPGGATSARPDPRQTVAARPRPVRAPSRPASRTAASSAATVQPFRSPATLARALVAAETAIRDPATPDAALVRSGWVQEQAYRDLATHPGWQAAVRPRVPARLRAAYDANVLAVEELRALTRPRRRLPRWRIVAPPPAEELLAHYRTAEREFGVPWETLAAIHLIETRMGRIRGASDAGALGPMQFLPSTWAAYGEGDINHPGDAIRAAARYLVAHGAPRSMGRALYAYNHSRHYVAAVQAFAGVMGAEPRTFFGYYHWPVYYRLVGGDVVLPVGYGR